MKLIPVVFVTILIIGLLKFIDAVPPTRVKIHVPTKIKKIYITKVITIPEHHHYFHEKEHEPEMPYHQLSLPPDFHGFSSYD